MKNKWMAIVLVSALVPGALVHAQYTPVDPNTQGDLVAPPPPPEPSGQQLQQPSINTGSAKGKKSQDKGAKINQMIGAAMIAAGMAQQPPNVPLIMMGMMALAQSAEDSKAAGESSATYGASLWGTEDSSTRPTPSADQGAGMSSPLAQQGLSELQNAGYTMNPDGTFTGPDGKKISGKTLSSAASMQAAGFDPQSAADAAAYLDKVNAEAGDGSEASVSSMAVDGSSAAGGGSGSGGAGDSDYSFSFKNPWKLSGAEKRKLVEGKSVNLAGEPIGVRGDNLFDMVHRAYERKVKADNFIEGGSTSVRAPASVGASKK